MDTIKPTKQGFASIAVPHEKQTEYLLDGLPKVRIRVGARGTLGFSLRSRINGKEKRLTLDVKQLSKSGVMSAILEAERRAEVEADVGVVDLQTIGEAVINNSDIAEGTKRNYKTSLKRLNEMLGTKLTGNAGDLLQAHHRIGEKYGKVSANNALKFYRRVLNYANAAYNTKIEWPVDKLRVLKIWNAEKPRTRRAEFSDIPAIWNAADDFPDPWGRILRFYMLTGLRNTEPFNGKVVGDDFVIENTKNKTTHTLPMTPTLKQIYGEGFGVKNGRRVKTLVEEALGIKLSPHDYRRTFSSLANHAGVPDYTISMILNHSKKDITGRYVGRSRDSMLLGLVKVEEAIQEMLQGNVQQNEFDDPHAALLKRTRELAAKYRPKRRRVKVEKESPAQRARARAKGRAGPSPSPS